jgi:hypothetical protein
VETWAKIDESLRPLGLQAGARTTWNGLEIERVQLLGPNWLYRVRAAKQAYRVNIFNPDPHTYEVAVWLIPPTPSTGLLIRQRVNVSSPDEALRFAVDVIRGVDEQTLPVSSSRSTNHRVTYATFRLFGYALDPDLITVRTGLQPSFRLPAPAVSRLTHLGPWRDGTWQLQSDARLDSLDLADHIRWLLDRLEPVRDLFPPWVDTYEAWRPDDAQSFIADMSCFWSGNARNPTFDPPLLRRLADLRLTLALDIYAADDADEDESE